MCKIKKLIALFVTITAFMGSSGQMWGMEKNEAPKGRFFTVYEKCKVQDCLNNYNDTCANPTYKNSTIKEYSEEFKEKFKEAKSKLAQAVRDMCDELMSNKYNFTGKNVIELVDKKVGVSILTNLASKYLHPKEQQKGQKVLLLPVHYNSQNDCFEVLNGKNAPLGTNVSDLQEILMTNEIKNKNQEFLNNYFTETLAPYNFKFNSTLGLIDNINPYIKGAELNLNLINDAKSNTYIWVLPILCKPQNDTNTWTELTAKEMSFENAEELVTKIRNGLEQWKGLFNIYDSQMIATKTNKSFDAILNNNSPIIAKQQNGEKIDNTINDSEQKQNNENINASSTGYSIYILPVRYNHELEEIETCGHQELIKIQQVFPLHSKEDDKAAREKIESFKQQYFSQDTIKTDLLDNKIIDTDNKKTVIIPLYITSSNNYDWHTLSADAVISQDSIESINSFVQKQLNYLNNNQNKNTSTNNQNLIQNPTNNLNNFDLNNQNSQNFQNGNDPNQLSQNDDDGIKLLLGTLQNKDVVLFNNEKSSDQKENLEQKKKEKLEKEKLEQKKKEVITDIINLKTEIDKVNKTLQEKNGSLEDVKNQKIIFNQQLVELQKKLEEKKLEEKKLAEEKLKKEQEQKLEQERLEKLENEKIEKIEEEEPKQVENPVIYFYHCKDSDCIHVLGKGETILPLSTDDLTNDITTYIDDGTLTECKTKSATYYSYLGNTKEPTFGISPKCKSEYACFKMTSNNKITFEAAEDQNVSKQILKLVKEIPAELVSSGANDSFKFHYKKLEEDEAKKKAAQNKKIDNPVVYFYRNPLAEKNVTEIYVLGKKEKNTDYYSPLTIDDTIKLTLDDRLYICQEGTTTYCLRSNSLPITDKPGIKNIGPSYISVTLSKSKTNNSITYSVEQNKQITNQFQQLINAIPSDLIATRENSDSLFDFKYSAALNNKIENKIEKPIPSSWFNTSYLLKTACAALLGFCTGTLEGCLEKQYRHTFKNKKFGAKVFTAGLSGYAGTLMHKHTKDKIASFGFGAIGSFVGSMYGPKLMKKLGRCLTT